MATPLALHLHSATRVHTRTSLPIDQEKRGANLAVRLGINPSTFCPASPSPHPSSLNQATIQSVLPLQAIVNGLIVLTDRRLCYLAYLLTFDKGQIIRSGPATVKADSR